MRKMISIFLMTFLMACAEDVNVLTSGEVAGNELRAQADRLQIQTAWIYEWSIHGDGYSQYSKVNEGSFSISGQLIRVENTLGSTYYNLDNLQSFSFDMDREIILIYFK